MAAGISRPPSGLGAEGGSRCLQPLPGLIVVCFGRIWVRDLPFQMRDTWGTHLIERTHFDGT